MTRYEQGFINKCAEYGIDGRVLLKEAQESQGGWYDPNDDSGAIEAGANSVQNPTTSKTPLSNTRLGALGGGMLSSPFFVASGLGAAAGALMDRKKRLRGALVGALLGGPALGIGGGYALGRTKAFANARAAQGV